MLTITTTGTSADQLTLKLTLNVAPEASNTTTGYVTPNGFKYTIEILGDPLYKLTPATNSSWILIKSIFTSSDNGTAEGHAIDHGAGRFDWSEGVVTDSRNTTIKFKGLDLNIPSFSEASSRGDENKDNSLDGKCNLQLAGFEIPYFQNSFVWDPTIFVDDVAAKIVVDSETSVKSSALPKALVSQVSIAVAIFASALLF